MLVIVGALGQRLAGEIVAAGPAGLVEAGIVDATAGRVHPARRNAAEDDGRGRQEGDDQVDGYERVEAGSLDGGAGEAV